MDSEVIFEVNAWIVSIAAKYLTNIHSVSSGFYYDT